jgi:hypothetical protein
MASSAGRSAQREFFRARRATRRSLACRLLIAVGGAGLSIAVLVRWGIQLSHDRLELTVFLAAVIVAAAAVVSASRMRKSDPGRWERGAAGERRTAEILAELPPRRWGVLHDLPVPGSRSNVDHLVIGPTGVWVVDSKTTLGEVRVGWRSVLLGGRRLDPSVTAWEASVVSERIGSPVSALIAVHARDGAFSLPRRGRSIGQGVRVVAAEGLPRRLRKGRKHLTGREVDSLLDLARAELVPGPARARQQVGNLG